MVWTMYTFEVYSDQMNPDSWQMTTIEAALLRREESLPSHTTFSTLLIMHELSRRSCSLPTSWPSIPLFPCWRLSLIQTPGLTQRSADILLTKPITSVSEIDWSSAVLSMCISVTVYLTQFMSVTLNNALFMLSALVKQQCVAGTVRFGYSALAGRNPLAVCRGACAFLVIANSRVHQFKTLLSVFPHSAYGAWDLALTAVLCLDCLFSLLIRLRMLIASVTSSPKASNCFPNLLSAHKYGKFRSLVLRFAE